MFSYLCTIILNLTRSMKTIGEHSNLSTIGFAICFVLMMVLDVVLG